MNYIYAGLSILILLQPIDALIREKQLRNEKTSNSNPKQAIELDGDHPMVLMLVKLFYKLFRF